MFFVIDKSKIFSYILAICTVIILFIAAAGISDISSEDSLMTSTNVVENDENITNFINMVNLVDNETI